MAYKEAPDLNPKVPPNAYPDSDNLFFTDYLQTFYGNHERMRWSVEDIPYDRIDTSLIRPEDVPGVMGAMLVESHNPVYTSGLLDYYRQDFEMTTFIPIWAYEEMKHFVALRGWLLKSDSITPQELAKVLGKTRAGIWGEDEDFTPLQAFSFTMLQEATTGRFYNKFERNTKEPVLRRIHNEVGKEEWRHCQFYMYKAKQELKRNPKGMEQLDELWLRWRMPGDTFIEDYARHGEAMRVAANVGTEDVKHILGKVKDLVGWPHVLKLAGSPSYRQKLSEEWGVDIMSVLRAT